jgi:glycogen debranching enzyme
MATALGKPEEADKWKRKADKLTELINKRMWHEESEFYYNINAKDHTFYYLTRDLKRQEIIGFLPLWAEVAPKDRAEKLIKHLTNKDKFWREYGVPTLAADDPWYSPDVDYCCKWNGPVWLLWNYMVYDGLKKYSYDDIADQLADKMIKVVEIQLRKNHNFWESFSPDNTVLNCPSNYIWDAIIAKVLIEKYQTHEQN